MPRDKALQRGQLMAERGGRGRGRGSAVLKAQGRVKKPASVKNQIRSIERLLKKTLAPDVKATQEAKLAELRKVADAHAKSELERKLAVRYHKIKFFERRKVERRIRRTERALRGLSDGGPGAEEQVAELNRQLAQLKEDLEYVRFYPKDQKYIALFATNEDEETERLRHEMRQRVKANIAAAKAAQIDLEEASGSEGEEGSGDMSDDDFFMKGDISDVDADDEWTDISPREDTLRGQSGSRRGKKALPLDSISESQEEQEQKQKVPAPVKIRQSSAKPERGGKTPLGFRGPEQGGGGSYTHQQGKQRDREGVKVSGKCAPGKVVGLGSKSVPNVSREGDKSRKRQAVGPALQAALPEGQGDEKKKRKRTRPKQKKKS